jgi:hypothetical protein
MKKFFSEKSLNKINYSSFPNPPKWLPCLGFSDPRSEDEVEATTSIQEQRFVLGMPTSGGRMNERRPYERAEVVRTIFGDFFFLDPWSGKSFACVDEETENGERRRV